MAFTAPTSVATGDVLTATRYNADVVNNMLAIGGAWTSFTPTWTNLTVGTGGSASNTGYYLNAGKLYIVRVKVIFGTSSPAFDSPILTLPNSASFRSDYTDVFVVGVGTATKSGGSAYPFFVYPSTGDLAKARLLITDVSGTYPSLTTVSSPGARPFAVGGGDKFEMQFMFEAA